MCIAFTPSTVYEFAFSHVDGLPDVRRISKQAIGAFIDALERDLAERGGFRYTYLAFGQDDVERFFMDERDRFLDFGDEVVFCGEFADDEARRIEERYEERYAGMGVPESLRVARLEARAFDLRRSGETAAPA